MDIPARRQLANVTRSATGELPAQSIQWWVVQLAAEVVDPDGRIVDQWTPLWIRAHRRHQGRHAVPLRGRATGGGRVVIDSLTLVDTEGSNETF